MNKQHIRVESSNCTQEGEYYIHWDGFDSNEIYDSPRFNGKDLKAKITVIKGGKQKNATVDFSTILQLCTTDRCGFES
jgi:hypothetical protein